VTRQFLILGGVAFVIGAILIVLAFVIRSGGTTRPERELTA